MKKLFIIALAAIAFTSCSKEEIEPVKTSIDLVIEVTGGDEAKFREMLIDHYSQNGLNGLDWYNNQLANNPNVFNSGMITVFNSSTFGQPTTFSTIGGHTLNLNVKTNDIINLKIVNNFASNGNTINVEDYLTIKVYRVDGPSNKVLLYEETNALEINYNVLAKDLF